MPIFPGIFEHKNTVSDFCRDPSLTSNAQKEPILADPQRSIFVLHQQVISPNARLGAVESQPNLLSVKWPNFVVILVLPQGDTSLKPSILFRGVIQKPPRTALKTRAAIFLLLTLLITLTYGIPNSSSDSIVRRKANKSVLDVSTMPVQHRQAV